MAAVITYFDCVKELIELVLIARLLVELLQSFENLVEITEDEGEDSDSQEENEDAEETFIVTPWIEISKAHR